ncbi:MAG: hypothetical protein IKA93_00700, partial [Elusimicrobiaceae bacterium]|nr:hypothetical protein [Elusimicrobiaceae bacterium]
AFYLRAAVGVENGLALPEDGAPHACFDALRAMLPELGYAPDDGGQEIAIRSRTGLAYAYVPIALE